MSKNVGRHISTILVLNCKNLGEHAPPTPPVPTALLFFNPNRGGGGGSNQDIRREIGCCFSQEPPRELKILDFLKNDFTPRVKSYFEHILILIV